jgi:hypothetical protein
MKWQLSKYAPDAGGVHCYNAMKFYTTGEKYSLKGPTCILTKWKNGRKLIFSSWNRIIVYSNSDYKFSNSALCTEFTDIIIPKQNS